MRTSKSNSISAGSIIQFLKEHEPDRKVFRQGERLYVNPTDHVTFVSIGILIHIH